MKRLAQLWYSLTNPPLANELACRELEEAQRQLLYYQSNQEYCTAMVQRESDRIARLTKYLRDTQWNY